MRNKYHHMLEMVGSRRSSLENKEIEGLQGKIDESSMCMSKETNQNLNPPHMAIHHHTSYQIPAKCKIPANPE